MLLEELIRIQEISRILRNPKVHRGYYNNNSSVPVLNQTNQLHAQVDSVLQFKGNHDSLIHMNIRTWLIKCENNTSILKSLPLALTVMVQM